jgi:hypothetical protein
MYFFILQDIFFSSMRDSYTIFVCVNSGKKNTSPGRPAMVVREPHLRGTPLYHVRVKKCMHGGHASGILLKFQNFHNISICKFYYLISFPRSQQANPSDFKDIYTAVAKGSKEDRS